MSVSSTRILSCLADAFLQGRIDYVTGWFAYPQPVYLQGDLQVFGSADTLGEALLLYREAALSIGTVTLRPRIVAEGVPVRGSSTLWVEWDHLDAEGRCLRTNQVRYVTHQAEGDLYPRVEMIDYTVTAFPDALATMPLSAIA